MNSPGRVLKLSEDHMMRILSETVLEEWVSLSDSIGSMQVIIKKDLDDIRWKALKSYYGCSDDHAKAIADGGQEAVFGETKLIELSQVLKQSRTEASPSTDKSERGSSKSDLIMRMELSAALVEAGMRG